MSTYATTRTTVRRGRTWAPVRSRAHATHVETGDLSTYLRALRSEPEAAVRLERGTALLPSLVRGCHHASITSVDGGRLDVRTATDATSRRAAELQDELDEGPCLHAVRTGHSVVAHDLRSETRWVRWCRRVVDDLEVTAAVSVLLTAPTSARSMLTLYSDTHAGLRGVEIALLHGLAAPLAAALVDPVEVDFLGPAA